MNIEKAIQNKTTKTTSQVLELADLLERLECSVAGAQGCLERGQDSDRLESEIRGLVNEVRSLSRITGIGSDFIS